MVSIKNVVFGLLFVLIGVGVAGLGVQQGYLAVKDIQSSVETTEATIQSSGIDSAQEREQEDGESEIEVEYYPRVTYQYSVDGQAFSGERIYSSADRNQEEGELAGKEFDSKFRAEDVAGQFPEGETVTVYYYPGDPSRSFLIPPTVDWMFVGITAIFGLMFGLGGIGAIFSDD